MSGEVRGVQSIEVGGRILAVMVKATQPMMLRDLAIQAKITPAQAHAYLVSFRKIGIVEQDVATGRYRLGGFALQLGLLGLIARDGGFAGVEGEPTAFEYWSLSKAKDGQLGYRDEPLKTGKRRTGLLREEFLELCDSLNLDAILEPVKS